MTPREAAIVAAYTGISIGSLGALHEYAEEKLARPVWVHEFAIASVAEELRAAARSDFLAIEVRE